MWYMYITVLVVQPNNSTARTPSHHLHVFMDGMYRVPPSHHLSSHRVTNTLAISGFPLCECNHLGHTNMKSRPGFLTLPVIFLHILCDEISANSFDYTVYMFA